ncbi:MAG: hypothetical protein AB7I32_11300 [Gammaproteobacteria bacterium]
MKSGDTAPPSRVLETPKLAVIVGGVLNFAPTSCRIPIRMRSATARASSSVVCGSSAPALSRSAAGAR